MQACHVFLQLGEPAAAQINGRKKAKIALQNFDQVTCSNMVLQSGKDGAIITNGRKKA